MKLVTIVTTFFVSAFSSSCEEIEFAYQNAPLINGNVGCCNADPSMYTTLAIFKHSFTGTSTCSEIQVLYEYNTSCCTLSSEEESGYTIYDISVPHAPPPPHTPPKQPPLPPYGCYTYILNITCLS